MCSRPWSAWLDAGLLCLLAWAQGCDAAAHEPACSGARCERGSVDAGPGDAAFVDAGRSDAAVTTDANLPPLSACTHEPPDNRFAPPTIVSSLATYCDALAAAGVARCPENRAAYLMSLGQECEPGRSSPQLDRRCGVDHVVTWFENRAVTWYFDAATGELIAAALMDPSASLPCGGTLYRGGAQLADCWTSDGSCLLCVADPDECPADVSASIPSTPCAGAPAKSPDCSCGDASSTGLALPENGAPCAAANQCERCAGGTCWADCRCLRDGSLRYVLMCTE